MRIANGWNEAPNFIIIHSVLLFGAERNILGMMVRGRIIQIIKLLKTFSYSDDILSFLFFHFFCTTFTSSLPFFPSFSLNFILVNRK